MNKTENTAITNPETETARTKRTYTKDRLVEFPREPFTAAGLAAQLNYPVHTVNNCIKRNMSKLEVIGAEPSKRGRAKRVYKML
ncbi:MAG: hypothetical protein WC567_03825 [Kiritimatiellia bacterium]|jgi:hypothetical protein